MSAHVQAQPRSFGVLEFLGGGELLAITVICLGLLWRIGEVIPPLLVITVGFLGCAGSVFLRWRWTPVLSIVLAVLAAIGLLVFASSYTIYHLAHPQDVPFFALVVLFLGLEVMIVLTNGVTLGQRTDRHMPAWLTPVLTLVVGVVLGSILVAAIPQTSTGGATAATTPTVHLAPGQFAPQRIVLSTGQSLTIVDDGAFLHVLANGTWAGTTPMPAKEPGAPDVAQLRVNGATATIGPFTTAGTFHIYCQIHPGMTLTVVVA